MTAFSFELFPQATILGLQFRDPPAPATEEEKDGANGPPPRSNSSKIS